MIGQFNSNPYDLRVPHHLKPLHHPDTLLDLAMIGLNAVL
jgi:hypothetical protein